MKLQLRVIAAILLLQHAAVSVGAANILGMFLSHSPSHVIVNLGIVRGLVERGHNVTVITSVPIKDKNPPYRHIYLKTIDFSPDTFFKQLNDEAGLWKIFKTFKLLLEIVFEKFAAYPSDPAFVSFLKEDNHFDLMLLGYMFNDYQLGVAAHFKCPVALTIMVQAFGSIHRIVGNPPHPEFVPFSPFMDPKPMDFLGRVMNFGANIIDRTFFGIMGAFSERVYNDMYPSDKYPSLTEVKNNVSLILVNHHFSEGPVRPLVPAVVEIGGITIKDKPDPLPEDVQQFLDSSPKGAIFFSLGSNVKFQHLGQNVTEIIYKTLSTIPYNVIMKFDTEKPPIQASNILFKKWLPQDDILAHKNLRLFITHGGKGSITESEYHQVPMVALPVFGDQLQNSESMQDKGHGIALEFRTMTEDSFRTAVLEVMENEKYRNKVRSFSEVYRDRPLTARQNAVYWIEYVIRHKGAPHMQSPLKTMNFLQENSIDVILFLGLIMYLSCKIIMVLVRTAIWIVKSSLELRKAKKD